MMKYLEEIRNEITTFKKFEIKQVPQERNTHANSLTSLVSTINTKLRRAIPILHLSSPSIIDNIEQPI